MKRVVIRAAMEAHLQALGFGRSSYEWLSQSAELVLVTGTTIRRIKLKAGMSQRALTFEMGRITGWADILGVQPRNNGSSRAAPAPALELHA
jgi:hypothetical protein